MSAFNPNDSSPPPLNPTGGPATEVCAECGRTFPADELVHHGNVAVCAQCKPVFMQKLAEGAQTDPGEMRYAGFWIRLLALFIDAGVLFALTFVFAFLAGMVVGLTHAASGSTEPTSPGTAMAVGFAIEGGMLLFLVFYESLMVGRFGATLGKMALRLRVVTADGGKVSYGRAFGRFGAKIISNLTFYIGYIMAGFDSEKRALHDHICGTRVIYK